jgi:hypothetical protein
MTDLLVEVPKPLYALRARLVTAYKFLESERIRLAEQYPKNSWNMFEPTREEELQQQQRDKEDSDMWARMLAYREVMTMIDQELDNIVREHLVMKTQK